MKGKIIAILVSLLVVVVIVTGSSMAGEQYGHQEPAPNAGSGDHLGSGFDHGDELGPGKGPAPNAGSGDHLGPGW